MDVKNEFIGRDLININPSEVLKQDWTCDCGGEITIRTVESRAGHDLDYLDVFCTKCGRDF